MLFFVFFKYIYISDSNWIRHDSPSLASREPLNSAETSSWSSSPLSPAGRPGWIQTSEAETPRREFERTRRKERGRIRSSSSGRMDGRTDGQRGWWDGLRRIELPPLNGQEGGEITAAGGETNQLTGADGKEGLSDYDHSSVNNVRLKKNIQKKKHTVPFWFSRILCNGLRFPIILSVSGQEFDRESSLADPFTSVLWLSRPRQQKKKKNNQQPAGGRRSQVKVTECPVILGSQHITVFSMLPCWNATEFKLK